MAGKKQETHITLMEKENVITLASLGVSPKKETQFHKKGIFSGEDLVRFFPYRYIDLSKITGILAPPEISTVIGTIQHVEIISNCANPFVLAKAVLLDGTPLTVYWFHQTYKYKDLKPLRGQRVLISGQIRFSESYHCYTVANPAVCSSAISESLRIYPVYSKIQNMSQEYLVSHIQAALEIPDCVSETVPQEFLRGKMSMPEAIRTLHHPGSMQALSTARERVCFDDLLYFALRMELANHHLPAASKFGIRDTTLADSLQASLPYRLTDSQERAVEGMRRYINAGKRLNALLQGDVGSGKTIVAFLMMASVISSGCQAAIVAPTRQLAQQHFEDMRKLLTPLGVNVALLGGTSMRASTRKQVLAGLADGTTQMVVGTQALFSASVHFHQLGLVIIDEEHKFGVMQRKALTDHAMDGVHCITMSATPIPRSLAISLYGDNMQVFSLDVPPGRKQTKTIAIDPYVKPTTLEQNREKERLNDFIRFQYHSGHQTYVVCPIIEKSDSEAVQQVITIERAAAWLKTLEPEGIRTEILTGSTKKADAAEILDRFRRNETNVLLATSIVEVGINIPSATGILILSPDRFGLASLHQLRGRVGRGNDQGYCVLFGRGISENERIQAMCRTNDGFQIAEEDLRIRGAGDFLGIQQSGDNKYVSLMLSNLEAFTEIKKLARKSLEDGLSYPLIDRAVRDFRAE